ncbi:MAG: protein-(glutamine-N5) methyltransferase, release factor-specific [Alphaproteobacteria bacterium TMED87]|nr:protein-(glutamine-N5) methyltransferase, release factor-specific [Rhodospirillaceae bacterium]OUV11349.1 MAG: protein-(glutamine-N5) methyltransferase, release factor-specific [Alphaproteobacteria bacterium TMED87]
MIYEKNSFLNDIILMMSESSIENPRLDAKMIISHALGCEIDKILLDPKLEVSNNQINQINKYVERRINGEPVSRIIGKREFWSLEFEISRATLDPRPDTEILLDTILKLINPRENISILDLGTGSGCILLSLLSEYKKAIGIGLDISFEAIRIAILNSKKLGFSNRAHFLVGNWLNPIKSKFDIIVSNPPYIKSNYFHKLQPEVKVYDPRVSLYGGIDGLDSYRLIIPMVKKKLIKGGFLVLEIGFDQKNPVKELLLSSGFDKITCHNDLSGNFRCISASN